MMQEYFLVQNLIESLEPWLIVVIASFLLWKVPVWKTKIEGRIEVIEFRMETIEGRMEVIEGRMEKIEGRIEKIEGNLEKLESKFEKIIDILVEAVGQTLAKHSSPLTLTDYGIAIAEKIDADDIASEYAEKLYSDIQSFNAYQIQEYCFDYCRNKLLDHLKENSPHQYQTIHTVAFEEGLEIENITSRTIGIKLRDYLLAKKESRTPK